MKNTNSKPIKRLFTLLFAAVLIISSLGTSAFANASSDAEVPDDYNPEDKFLLDLPEDDEAEFEITVTDETVWDDTSSGSSDASSEEVNTSAEEPDTSIGSKDTSSDSKNKSSDSKSKSTDSKSKSSGSKSKSGKTKSGKTCISYLTGETVPKSVGRKRPMALMIENDAEAAKWQNGTGSASIIYEARVEGGITRLLGLFEDFKDTERIMPIRSCRPQFVYYSREFNAFYGHYGQVIYAVQLLQMPETYDIAGLPHGEDGQQYTLNDGRPAYVRDHPGVTGIYTNFEKLKSFIKDWGWSRKYPEDYEGHYQFAEEGTEVELDSDIDALVVLPGFVSNHSRLEYNEADKLYYRSEFGDPQIDHLTGKQLSFKNILIQIGPSYDLDGRYCFTDPVNEGKAGEGWYITNGRAERITWQKENWSASEPILETVTAAQYSFDIRDCDFNITRYYDSEGNEITLNTGKTMVEIIREEDASKLVISDDLSTDSYMINDIPTNSGSIGNIIKNGERTEYFS